MGGRSNPAAAFVLRVLNADALPRMNVFLVGPMGSGKSAVGRQLAQRLALEFIDSDEQIEARTGVDISYIFEREGESGFRQREAEVIDAITRCDGVLVSTGGGAVLDAGTRERLRARGRVVYLRTSVEQQLARTRRSNDRPLLNNDDPRGTLERLFVQRAPLYDGGGRDRRRHGRPQGEGRGRPDLPPARRRRAGTMTGSALQTLQIDLGARSYPIVIGEGLLDDPELVGRHVTARDVLIVTNETVAPLYAGRLLAGLGGKRVRSVELPDGEQFKTLSVLERVFDALIDARLNRDACVVALGGGVVGDMAGFAAACYQRGVDFVQVPTTLLAQVDSAVGGKTGVNHPGGKNMIGAFHQPRAVLSDLGTLRTLPPRELRAGLAEVIKYGLIDDADFLAWIEANVDRLLALDMDALGRAVRRSCEIKARIVAADEREHGQRALLNLGHTFGHAIETAAGYGEWLHGEAVAMGMLLAADLSQRLGYIDPADVARVRELLRRAGLPIEAPAIGAARALELMGMDKKVLQGRIRLVLLRKLGEGIVTGDYPADALQATLRGHFEVAA